MSRPSPAPTSGCVVCPGGLHGRPEKQRGLQALAPDRDERRQDQSPDTQGKCGVEPPAQLPGQVAGGAPHPEDHPGDEGHRDDGQKSAECLLGFEAELTGRVGEHCAEAEAERDRRSHAGPDRRKPAGVARLDQVGHQDADHQGRFEPFAQPDEVVGKHWRASPPDRNRLKGTLLKTSGEGRVQGTGRRNSRRLGRAGSGGPAQEDLSRGSRPPTGHAGGMRGPGRTRGRRRRRRRCRPDVPNAGTAGRWACCSTPPPRRRPALAQPAPVGPLPGPHRAGRSHAVAAPPAVTPGLRSPKMPTRWGARAAGRPGDGPAPPARDRPERSPPARRSRPCATCAPP